MKTIFYTRIERDGVADKQSEILFIKRAQILGYNVSTFAGWTNEDLGMSANHGPRWNDSRSNRDAISEVLKTLPGYICVYTTATENAATPLEDEDALTIARRDLGEMDEDI